ncbi:protein-glutamine gamma-glutamyltransferase K-like [Amphiura filiformis]|uniref:protein-glutamine gamma-glutamyltransferase K-like n=1 Tax=Amphiura filiformis TaxID=82378 RepID=UPI003B21C334
MPRSSSRTRNKPVRFGYNADGEPYPTGSQQVSARALRQPGRRVVPEEPVIIEKPPKKEKQLKVLQLDVLMEKNMEAHHTDEYETEEMVLRRGRSFDMEVTLHRDFMKDSDKISLEFRMGGRPIISHGTRVPVYAVDAPPKDNLDWGLQITSIEGSKVCLTVYSSADSLIGPYKLEVNTATESGIEFEFEHPTEVFMIFNPWCKQDGVYMADVAKRDEYVMNETNLVYEGTRYKIGNFPWYQGQFEDVVLECAFHLLKKSGLAYRHRRNPVMIARTMSALLNSQDEDGVLVGSWSGDYADGVDPSLWTGSIAILKKYMETGKPVEYAQCWVFGSLFTTIMRALGVPTRTVTNFESAHDTDSNLTLDYHYDEDGNALDNLNEDTIWNFHVWNDSWMARPDLPEGYGGWQAVDATPQETSSGVFQMGPASLTAIKKGHVYFDYDTKFAFAEVNAETVTWIVPKDSRKPPTVSWVDPNEVGIKISTKAVGKDERHDITGDYKFREGSNLERIAVYTASKYVEGAKNVIKDVKQDVEFKVKLPEYAMIGTDFNVTVNMTNNATSSRKIYLAVNGSTIYYTGIKKTRVVERKKYVNLDAGESKTVSIKCDADDYLPELTEFAGFSFFVMGKVSETKQVISRQFATVLDKPDITITAEGDITAGTPFYAKVSFTNPLPYTLNNCQFLVEGPGIESYKEEKFRNVMVGEKVEHKIKLTPKKPGTRTLMVSFKSNKLAGVRGSADLVVLAA